MNPKPADSQSTPEIEIKEHTPTALIASNEAFLASYLAQILLELPLRVIFLTTREVEEVKHLLPNRRFSLKLVNDLTSMRSEDFQEIDYLFQIINEKSATQEIAEKLATTKKLLEIAQTKAAKYQLTTIFDSPDSLRDRLPAALTSQSEEKQQFNSAQPIKDPLEKLVRDASRISEFDARLSWACHLYGPKMPIRGNWEFPRLLQSLHDRSQLLVAAEGMAFLYPLFVLDAAKAITKAMFVEGAKNFTPLIIGDREISSLNLAYKIRELVFKETGFLPEIKVESLKPAMRQDRFIDKFILREYLKRTQSTLAWKQQTDIDAGLQATLDWLGRGVAIAPKPSPIKIPETKAIKIQKTWGIRKITKPRIGLLKSKFAIALALVFIAIITPITIFSATVGDGALSLLNAQNALYQARFEVANANARRAEKRFAAAQRQLALAAFIIPGGKDQTNTVDKASIYLKAGNLLAEVFQHATRGAEQATQIKSAILAESNDNLQLTLTKLASELDALYRKLSFLEALLQDNQKLEGGKLSQAIDRKISQLQASIPRERSLIVDIRELVNLAPQLLGINGQRTYLVLLQNNAELRPTGGFIGSYALATFENANLVDLVVEDVYTADGQLKGHVEPPAEIKRHLGEAGWYLRDSNWDPDFPSAARQAEWFFAKETGKTVDGTIAVNLFVIQEVLEALGPITVSDYQEQVTAGNLFATAERYSELNFFPGSTQKKDFLGSLSNSLFFSLVDSQPQTLIRVARALYNSLKKGQLLLAVHDPALAAKLAELGWDGSLKEVPCPTNTQGQCANQFIAIREANVAVNKANYFIKREITLLPSIRQDVIETSLKVRYQNEGRSNTWPGGTYKNFMRVYLNPEAEIVAVKIEGERLADDELTIVAEHGKKSVGFLVTVPVGKERLVELVFQSETPKFTAGKANLVWLLQKQPGTQDDPLTFVLNSADKLKLSSANQSLTSEGNHVGFSQNFSQDIYLAVELMEIN